MFGLFLLDYLVFGDCFVVGELGFWLFGFKWLFFFVFCLLLIGLGLVSLFLFGVWAY